MSHQLIKFCTELQYATNSWLQRYPKLMHRLSVAGQWVGKCSPYSCHLMPFHYLLLVPININQNQSIAIKPTSGNQYQSIVQLLVGDTKKQENHKKARNSKAQIWKNTIKNISVVFYQSSCSLSWIDCNTCGCKSSLLCQIHRSWTLRKSGSFVPPAEKDPHHPTALTPWEESLTWIGRGSRHRDQVLQVLQVLQGAPFLHLQQLHLHEVDLLLLVFRVSPPQKALAPMALSQSLPFPSVPPFLKNLHLYQEIELEPVAMFNTTMMVWHGQHIWVVLPIIKNVHRNFNSWDWKAYIWLHIYIYINILYLYISYLYEIIWSYQVQGSPGFPKSKGAFLCTSAQSTEWPRRTWETQYSAWRFPKDWHCRCFVKATQKLEEHSRWRFTLVVEKNKRRIHHCKMDGKWKVLPQCPNLLHCFASKGLHQRGLAWRKDRRPMKRLDLAVKVNNFCDTNVTLTWWITERETTSTRMT